MKPCQQSTPALRSPIYRALSWVLLVALAVVGFGCQASSSNTMHLEPLRAIDRRVDLERFMGDWYVIAHIPAFIEDEAHNAVESYQLDKDGSIATTYVFNNGSLDGPLKTYRPTGFIHNRETNAEWRMQFLWPFKSAYLIAYLDESYQTTIVGVPDRDLVWIMARSKTLPEARYQELVKWLGDNGHDLTKLRRVPHL